MGIAANKFRLLYLTQHKSDIEYKLSVIFQRRKALTDQSIQLAQESSNNIFQTDATSDLYGGTTPGALPGLPGLTVTSTDPVPTGDYESRLFIIQAEDKALEMDAESLDIMLESAKTEKESIDALLKKNIEKEYKTFAN